MGAADRVSHLVPIRVQSPTLTPRVTLTDFATVHSVSLNRFAYLLCGDRALAEDLVQEAFLALYRRFGESLSVAAPLLYARQVIVNANVSHWRRRASSEQVLADLPEDTLGAFHRAVLGQQDHPGAEHDERDAMWQALSALPDRQRAVLILRYYLDLTDREIGDLLGCRESSVRSLAARAFAALRKLPAFAEIGAVR
jgi:RNA polymerase sigma-70 factor (sigma-E family)